VTTDWLVYLSRFLHNFLSRKMRLFLNVKVLGASMTINQNTPVNDPDGDAGTLGDAVNGGEYSEEAAEISNLSTLVSQWQASGDPNAPSFNPTTGMAAAPMPAGGWSLLDYDHLMIYCQVIQGWAPGIATALGNFAQGAEAVLGQLGASLTQTFAGAASRLGGVFTSLLIGSLDPAVASGAVALHNAQTDTDPNTHGLLMNQQNRNQLRQIMAEIDQQGQPPVKPASQTGNQSNFSTQVNGGAVVPLDPVASYAYIYNSVGSSTQFPSLVGPKFSSVILPDIIGSASHYKIYTMQGNSWTFYSYANPLQEVTFDTPQTTFLVTGADTSGLAPGTSWVSGVSFEGTGYFSGSITTLTQSQAASLVTTPNVPAQDFTGGNTSDVLLQNGGSVVDWIMQNGAYSSGNVLTTGATGFSVVGTGDFTGDGTSDVLLQNGGTVVDWILYGGFYQGGNVITTAAAGYTVVGTGDLTGNGVSDVLLQNGGTVVDWVMSNGQYQSGNVLTTGAMGWSVVGTGDFTGNGINDVLLQNGGTVVDWLIQNGKYQSGNVLTTGAAGWTVVGTGDFTGNGTSDVLLQNGGTVVDWIMKNGQYQSGNIVTTAATGFTVVGTGDYNGDGTSDALLQNGGTVVDWIMKNGQYSSGNVITTAATGYTVSH
jgi:uncharacterized protein YukJ